MLTDGKAFQTAVELSERGKHEDDARNYPSALPLYELAMDYYLQALKGISPLLPPILSSPIPSPTSPPLLINIQMNSGDKRGHKEGDSRPNEGVPGPCGAAKACRGTDGRQCAPQHHSRKCSSRSLLLPSYREQLGYATGWREEQGVFILLLTRETGGTCAACGGVLLGSSLSALDRVWHPECFVGNVMCAGCLQPFALTNMLMKIKEGKPYLFNP